MIVHCAPCSAELPPGADRCPRCGSDDIMIGMFTPEGIRVSAARDAGVRIIGKGHETVKGRFLRAGIKQEWSHELQLMLYVERTIDRVNRVYHEVYYHPITGEIVFEKHPPIEDQSAHGPRGKRH